MAFRFQKRIKILPGVTANLSKSGVSTSVGVTGAKVTVGHGKTRVTTGIPSSGISNTEFIKSQAKPSVEPQNDTPENDTKNLWLGIGFIVALILIASMISKCTG